MCVCVCVCAFVCVFMILFSVYRNLASLLILDLGYPL